MKYWLTIGLILSIFIGGREAVAAEIPPQVGTKGQSHYLSKYRNAKGHKAFVIAPAGGWQWKAKKSSPEAAIKAAKEKCEKKNDVCVVYDVDGEKVFDEARWASILAPYPSAADSASAPIGAERGNRFPDLAFKTEDGEEMSISDFRGKFLLVNIWASWCPPCQTEMPSLDALYKNFKDDNDVQFLMIGTREPSSKSFDFVKWKKYSFPVFHTGVTGKKHNVLPLKNGDSISGKKIGSHIPTTLILNRNGVVIFRKQKGFDNWDEFTPQLKHIIENAG